MKTLLRFGFLVVAVLLSLAVALLWSVNARAEQATMSTTFSYSDGGDADATMQGVKLYVDGQVFCQADLTNIRPDGDNKVFECTNELAYGTRNYTLTAIRADGDESPHSVPFSYTINAPPPGPPDQPPTPLLIEIRIIINGVEYTITN